MLELIAACGMFLDIECDPPIPDAVASPAAAIVFPYGHYPGDPPGLIVEDRAQPEPKPVSLQREPIQVEELPPPAPAPIAQKEDPEVCAHLAARYALEPMDEDTRTETARRKSAACGQHW